MDLKINKQLKIVVLGLFFMLLSACYGEMMPFSATLKIKNCNNSGIPGLKISYKNSSEDSVWVDLGFTDINGEYRFSTLYYNNEKYQFLIEDTDACENIGYFKTTSVNLEDDLENIILLEKQ